MKPRLVLRSEVSDNSYVERVREGEIVQLRGRYQLSHLCLEVLIVETNPREDARSSGVLDADAKVGDSLGVQRFQLTRHGPLDAVHEVREPVDRMRRGLLDDNRLTEGDGGFRLDYSAVGEVIEVAETLPVFHLESEMDWSNRTIEQRLRNPVIGQGRDFP